MSVNRAFLGISHSPLLGLNPIPADVDADLQSGIDAARRAVHDFDPSLVILVGPDHYNGFFNELIGRALKARGWKLVRDGGYRYWSMRRFEKRS